MIAVDCRFSFSVFPEGTKQMPYDTRNVLIASRYFLAKAKSGVECGANKEGGGGFTIGNTCGAGGGKEPAKPKLTKAEREEKSNQDFEDNMKTKSRHDETAFRKARAEGVFIPQAWTEIEYNGKDANKIATGRDGKGRRQPMQNRAYTQRVSDANNARIDKELIPKISEIRESLKSDAKSGSEEAKALYLMSLTGFRIGGKGDGKAEKEAFGASSLLGKHVSVDGDTVTFDFPGKKGVEQRHTITDSVVAGMMKDLKPETPVFSTRAEKVRKAWQTKYGGKKPHDLRHVVATETAKSEIAKRVPPPPGTAARADEIVKDVAAAVGKKLGNNANQALKTYISPSVWDSVKVK